MSNTPAYRFGFHFYGFRLPPKRYTKCHIFLDGKTLCGKKLGGRFVEYPEISQIDLYVECKTCLKLYAKQTGENT